VIMNESVNVPVITIDGPSGAGKGTIALMLAKRLQWNFLDSGSLYRLLALCSIRSNVNKNIQHELASLAEKMIIKFDYQDNNDVQVWLGNEEVSLIIRTDECSHIASHIATLPNVRLALHKLQHSFLKKPGLVADGRDMGTHVFKDADLKIFLTADIKIRAMRRYKQLKGKGINVNVRTVLGDLKNRDKRDYERSLSPLKPAENAKILDSSNLNVNQVIKVIMNWVNKDVREKYVG